MRRKIRISLLLVLTTFLCGCSYSGFTERTDAQSDAYSDVLLPESLENAYGQTIRATLYFRYLSENLLAGVEREFTVTAETSIEEMVVQALIDGPEDNQYQYSALVHPDTKLVSVKEQSGYLSITLSREFLNEMENMDIDNDVQRRKLAVQSIVDTITGIGNYSRVLILIDHNGTGNGERLTYTEAGWEEYGDRTIEPMERDTDVILSPENVLDIAMRAIVEKDYDRLESFLADTDYDGSACPTHAEILNVLEKKDSIVNFSRTGSITVSGDGKRAVGLVDITYVDASGHPTDLKRLPVRMMLEDVWKVSFASLDAMFPEY